jgi:hypothetical protein
MESYSLTLTLQIHLVMCVYLIYLSVCARISRNICAEGRRKYPDLQTSAERAMLKLRTVATGGQPVPSAVGAPIKQPIDVLHSESVLRPLLLACSSKNPKLCTLALASIQRLVSLTPLNPRFLATVMGTLRIQAESEDQSVQLKVLQTLLLTISPAAVECGELLRGSLLQALSICFRLFLQKKSAPIHHTAFAALRQLVALLFERVSWQSQQGLMWQQTSQQQQLANANAASAINSELGAIPVATPIPPSNTPPSSLLPSPLDQLSYEAQNAYLLFQDLCILSANGGSAGMDPVSANAAVGTHNSSMGGAAASSTRPRWLTTLLSSSIPAEVCIELLENIVEGSVALFRSQPVFFSNLIQRDLCTLLLRLLRSHFDFPIVLRLIRCVLVLIKAFHASLVGEVELFLSLFIRMTHASFPLWHRVLVLEAILAIFKGNGEKFSYWIFVQFDLTPALKAEAAALAEATAAAAATPGGMTAMALASAASTAAAAAEAAPPPNPNQTRIFTSLIHTLSRLVIQTGTALCGDAGGGVGGIGNTSNSALSGSLSGGGTLSLAVGTAQGGFSSASSALLTAIAPSPTVLVTVPTSPTANSSSNQSQSSSSPNRNNSMNVGGVQETVFPWKLYTPKGNRGLDLLNLEQEMSGSGGSGSGSGSILSSSSNSLTGSSTSGQSLTASNMYEESYVVTLGIECIVCVVNGLAALAKTNEKWGGSHQKEVLTAATTSLSSSASPPMDAASLPVDLTLLRQMASASCMPILGALSFLLSHTGEETQIQYILMAYQSFTNTAGVLELTRARDQFLMNLCAFALPHNGLPRDDPPSELIKTLFPTSSSNTLTGSGSSAGNAAFNFNNPSDAREFAANLHRFLLSPKNIQSLKALFNISHCLGAFLGSASWLLVLETFQSLDTMIQLSTEIHYRLARAGASTGGAGGNIPSNSITNITNSSSISDHTPTTIQELYNSLLPHQTEINIMASALSRLFESTKYLDDKAVTHVLSALGTLSLSALANAATNGEGSDGRPAHVGGASLPMPGSAHTAHSIGGSGSGASLLSTPAPQSIRMFALVNLISTLEHNLFRLTTAHLWDIGVGHLTCVINHKDSFIRSYGVAALTKIAILALKKPSTYLQPTFQSNQTNIGSNTGSRKSSSLIGLDPSEYTSRIQRSLLEPFSDLFRSKYEDTRENILISLFQILQAGGQALGKGGWGVVMNILQAVVQGQGGAVTSTADGNETSSSTEGGATVGSVSRSVSDRTSVAPASSPVASASFIHVGFNSIQLITNDFLETVPFSALAAMIDVVKAYCAQYADTNISFMSIGLLWRISDYIAKQVQSGGNKQVETTSDGTDSTGSPTAVTSPPEVLSDALADSLMQQVFTSLVSLSIDSRTEVRNSAVKTLHNTLVAHASRMALGTCIHVLHSLVLPLLSRLLLEKTLEDNVRNQSVNSTELGKDKTTGKSVMMLIHYSRDTASKQWDETRVFALQGTARVLKGYIDTLGRTVATSSNPAATTELTDAFVQEWFHYLQLNLTALSNRSPEVTLAALNAVQDLAALLFTQQQQQSISTGLSSSMSNSALSNSLPSAGTVPSGGLSPTLFHSLWTAVLERFYIRGVIHALIQHRHIEWVEEQERRIETERKERKVAGVAAIPPVSVDWAASPFQTAFGDLNAEEGWKSWVKTYTHLLGNLHTLIPLIRRILDGQQTSQMDQTKRDDLTLLMHLSHVLVRMHASYTEQRARAIFAQRKQGSGSTNMNSHEVELSMVDRKETPLQAAHLKLLESLCSTPIVVSTNNAAPLSSSLTSALWCNVFEQLLSYLLSDYAGAMDIAQVELQLNSLLAGSTLPSNDRQSLLHDASSTSNAPLQFASTSFAKKVLRLLDRLFTSVAPALVRADQFALILSVLQRVLDGSAAFIRDQGYQELCEESVAAFIHILDAGLQSVNERMEEVEQARESDAIHMERERLCTVWNMVVAIFASFLAPPSVAAELKSADSQQKLSVSLFDYSRGAVLLPLRSTAAQQRVWENLQIALVGCLVRIVLPQIAHAPAGRFTLQALVSFLNIGFDESGEDESMQSPSAQSVAAALATGDPNAAGSISLAPATNELLSHSCLMALFLLSRAGMPGSMPTSRFSRHESIAALTAPLLFHRCRSILESYLALDRFHAPNVPVPRCRREELGFVLRELCTLEIHPSVTAPLFTHRSSPTGTRAHLLKLFPILCQCITMRESELRELLRDVFQLASIELGLQDDPIAGNEA